MLGKRPVAGQRPDCGLSVALRFVVTFEDGTSVFAKAATDGETEQWLRNEHHVLADIAAPFMPPVFAWDEAHGERPLLLTEDLSRDGYWPASHAGVAWRPGDFDAVFAGIEAMSRIAPPDGIPALANKAEPAWPALASRAAGIGSLGVCSEEWLDQCGPALVAAEKSLDVEGACLVHGDLRSDNICISGGRAVFVDWSHASRGNSDLNLASILASLHLEGGPPPAKVMPGGGAFAARDAATLIRRLLDDDGAPAWLKPVLRELAIINLDWAAESLALQPRT